MDFLMRLNRLSSKSYNTKTTATDGSGSGDAEPFGGAPAQESSGQEAGAGGGVDRSSTREMIVQFKDPSYRKNREKGRTSQGSYSIPSRTSTDAGDSDDDLDSLSDGDLEKVLNEVILGPTDDRSSLIDSIKWLARNVPQCVIRQLSEETLLTENRIGDVLASQHTRATRRMSKESLDITEQMQMPHGTQYEAALLFIDMSGFTNLAQKLDVEKFSKTINAYFRTIVDEVISRGGDILKFAGDAIFVEWRAGEKFDGEIQPRKKSMCNFMSPSVCLTNTSNANTLSDCVYAAAVCGAMVVKKCADYPVYTEGTSEKVATLNVHCGLGVGKMGGVHVGNDHSRRMYLVIGNPIDQVSEACDSARLGEIRASAAALKYLNKGQSFKYKLRCNNGEVSKVIASKQKMFFRERKKSSWNNKGKNTPSPQKENSEDKFEIPFDDMNHSSLRAFKKMLSFYIHPVVMEGERIDKDSLGLGGSRHSYVLGEPGARKGSLTKSFHGANTTTNTGMGRVGSTGALNKSVHGAVSRTGGRGSRRSSFTTGFNRASMTNRVTQMERHRSEAELRSVFTIFIKPNIEAKLTSDPDQNRKMFHLLNDIMNVVTSALDNYKGHLLQFIVDDKGVILIGTFGLRGSTFPHMVAERALPTCRLVSSTLASELGIDSQIGATLGKVYCGVVGGVERHEFSVLGASVNLAARLMAQKNHPGIMVDEEVRKEASKVNFVAFPPVKAKGYKLPVPVYKPLTAEETRWGKVNPKFVGRKKEMEEVCQLAVQIGRRRSPSKMCFVWGESGAGKSSFVVQTIALVNKTLKKSRRNALITRNMCGDGDALIPFSLFRSIFRDVLSGSGRDDASVASHHDRDVLRQNSSKERDDVIDRLREMCTDIGAPPGLIEVIGHHLLGSSRLKMSKAEKTPDLEDIIIFMAKLFIKATSHAEMVVLAMDDVQWLDNLSWKVVQHIFEESNNLLIVCALRPLEEYSLTMDESFWELLVGKYQDQFTQIPLGSLEPEEIRDMTALFIDCKSSEVDDEVVDDICRNSGGLPHFASEILDNCVKNNRFETLPNKKWGWCEAYKQSNDDAQFANLNELMLQRIDNMSEITRKVLQFGSVLGASFYFNEILEISGHILFIEKEDMEDHSMEVLFALEAAVEEGILDETVQDNEDDNESVDQSDFLSSLGLRGSFDKNEKKVENHEYRKYTFHHSSWQRVVLSLLLDSWKRDIHKHAAMAIEAKSPDAETRDIGKNVKLFRHWKESDSTVKASDIALDIGQSYRILGLNEHSTKIYDSALEMWKKHQLGKGEKAIGGYSPQLLQSMDAANLVSLVKLQTALGQAVGSTLNKDKNESAQAFADALSILDFTPVSAEIKDRAFIFPIYSGMFFLLKYGVSVDTTENELIANFVDETKKHGDPVHYCRALAMQGETYHRQGKYSEAIKSHMALKRAYDVKKHHALVVASYASDRVGQNFGCTANCYMRLGELDKAMKIVDHIITYLIPQMEPKNVHNSIVTIYPAIWILKDNGRAEKAREIFLKYVTVPFKEHFGEDGTTPFLPAFKGIETLLDLVLYMEGKMDSFDAGYFDWALDMKNLEIKKAFDSSIGNFGRNSSSTNAEICLRLSKLTDDAEKKKRLIENGLKVAEQALSRCDGSDGPKLMTTYLQIKPVYDDLKLLATR